MTTALEGMSGHPHAPAALYPRERPGTHRTGGWVGPRAGLDRCGISRQHRDSIPVPSSPYPVVLPTTLPGPRLPKFMLYNVTDDAQKLPKHVADDN